MFRFSAFALAFCAASVATTARADETVIYKHNQWPLSVIEFRDGKTGPAKNYAYRYDSWRQMGDAYSIYNPTGAEVAQASFERNGLLAKSFCGTRMVVADAMGKPVGTITGTCATWHRGMFTIADADAKPLAVAYVGYGGDDVVVVDAATQRRMLATLSYLEPLPSMEPAFWTFRQFDSEALPAASAHALVAFLVDYQTWVAPYGSVAQTGTWLATGQSLYETLKFWATFIPLVR